MCDLHRDQISRERRLKFGRGIPCGHKISKNLRLASDRLHCSGRRPPFYTKTAKVAIAPWQMPVKHVRNGGKIKT